MSIIGIIISFVLGCVVGFLVAFNWAEKGTR